MRKKKNAAECERRRMQRNAKEGKTKQQNLKENTNWQEVQKLSKKRDNGKRKAFKLTEMKDI